MILPACGVVVVLVAVLRRTKSKEPHPMFTPKHVCWPCSSQAPGPPPGQSTRQPKPEPAPEPAPEPQPDPAHCSSRLRALMPLTHFLSSCAFFLSFLFFPLHQKVHRASHDHRLRCHPQRLCCQSPSRDAATGDYLFPGRKPALRLGRLW